MIMALSPAISSAECFSAKPQLHFCKNGVFSFWPNFPVVKVSGLWQLTFVHIHTPHRQSIRKSICGIQSQKKNQRDPKSSPLCQKKSTHPNLFSAPETPWPKPITASRGPPQADFLGEAARAPRGPLRTLLPRQRLGTAPQAAAAGHSGLGSTSAPFFFHVGDPGGFPAFPVERPFAQIDPEVWVAPSKVR